MKTITATTDRRTLVAELAAARAEVVHWRQREIERHVAERAGKNPAPENDEAMVARIAAQIELARTPKDPNAGHHRATLLNALKGIQ